jgi:hypothetical protein
MRNKEKKILYLIHSLDKVFGIHGSVIFVRDQSMGKPQKALRPILIYQVKDEVCKK